MNRLLINNSAKYRLLRTILQGVIGVIIANLDLLVGEFSIDPALKPVIVGVVMAILSPIMASLGTTDIPEKEDLPDDYFEGGDNLGN